MAVSNSYSTQSCSVCRNSLRWTRVLFNTNYEIYSEKDNINILNSALNQYCGPVVNDVTDLRNLYIACYKMNTYAISFGVLLCLVAVNCRNLAEKNEQEGLPEDIRQLQEGNVKKTHDHNGNQRHRRRRWQNNYGYNYQQPAAPFYQEEWRNIDRSQQDLLPQINRLLDEISEYIRRPAPTPQPIYVPYPVSYPAPQTCRCQNRGNYTPDITIRFPELDDVNQNWGYVDSNDADYEEDSDDDGRRPVSFAPIKPIRPSQLPVPNVEHGSSQHWMDQPAKTPFAGQDREASSKVSGVCNAAILKCCRKNNQQWQRACFNNSRCGSSYSLGYTCSQQSIFAALEFFRNTYSPAN